jgi:predicted nucleic acid-binding protein
MIAVDTNILVYAHREDAPWHQQAYARILELAGRADALGDTMALCT